MKKVNHLWERMPSGVLLPTGMITDISDSATTSFLQVKDKAVEIEGLFRMHGLALPQASQLAMLINNCKRLWEEWFMNRMDRLNMNMLFTALHLDRIAEAVLPLREAPNCRSYLQSICDGSLDFFKREKSRAKDIFWEIETWAILKRKLPNVSLCEPPDILVDFGNANIGIACKKIYSEKHVQNVLSQAVSQIEKNLDVGIVAVNIDDLVPADKVLKAASFQEMTQVVRGLNESFIQRHERHFRKYLASGRLISAIVSTSLISDIESEKIRINNSRQWTVWTIPGLAESKNKVLRRFYDSAMR